MIFDINDEDALNMLMTSDFIDELRPPEYKHLIFKFRDFYRVLHGNLSGYKTEAQFLIDQMSSSIEDLKIQLYNIKVERAKIQDELDFLKARKKLTWKERILGKLDDNRGI